MQLQRRRLARAVQCPRHLVDARRAVEVVRHVVFARPDQLHWRAHCLGDLDRLRHVVEVDPPAEAAAEEGGLHGDLRGLEARDRRRHALSQLLELDRANEQRRVLPHVGGEVHRLERRMRQERQLVVRLDRLRGALHAGLHVALPLDHGPRLCGRRS